LTFRPDLGFILEISFVFKMLSCDLDDESFFIHTKRATF